MGQPTSILVVDNYDSFVWTIVGYLQQLGAECTVVRNDEIEPQVAESYDGVLVSPGPGTPEDAGISMDIIRYCAQIKKPMLGVCLGHQALGVVYGATVTHAEELMHGKTSVLTHSGGLVFTGVPAEFRATRYHSLAMVTHTVPDELEVTCRTRSGVVMGVQHRELPLHGVQFHPESVLTEGGHQLLANWLQLCGDQEAVTRAQGLGPLVKLPAVPVSVS